MHGLGIARRNPASRRQADSVGAGDFGPPFGGRTVLLGASEGESGGKSGSKNEGGAARRLFICPAHAGLCRGPLVPFPHDQGRHFLHASTISGCRIARRQLGSAPGVSAGLADSASGRAPGSLDARSIRQWGQTSLHGTRPRPMLSSKSSRSSTRRACRRTVRRPPHGLRR